METCKRCVYRATLCAHCKNCKMGSEFVAKKPGEEFKRTTVYLTDEQILDITRGEYIDIDISGGMLTIISKTKLDELRKKRAENNGFFDNKYLIYRYRGITKIRHGRVECGTFRPYDRKNKSDYLTNIPKKEMELRGHKIWCDAAHLSEAIAMVEGADIK